MQIFHTGSGPLAGTEDKFPSSDNLSKMRRSIENAEHVGEQGVLNMENCITDILVRSFCSSSRPALPG